MGRVAFTAEGRLPILTRGIFSLAYSNSKNRIYREVIARGVFLLALLHEQRTRNE
jgi:hypothetical protein